MHDLGPDVVKNILVFFVNIIILRQHYYESITATRSSLNVRLSNTESTQHFKLAKIMSFIVIIIVNNNESGKKVGFPKWEKQNC